MNELEQEKEKAKEVRDKRTTFLSLAGLGYVGIAIVFSLFGPKDIPTTQVFISLTIAVAVGFLMSLISVRLSYETSVRLIEMNQTLKAIKRKMVEVELKPETIRYWKE